MSSSPSRTHGGSTDSSPDPLGFLPANMAALVCLRHESRYLARILAGKSYLGPVSGRLCESLRSHSIKSHPSQTLSSSFHTTAFTSAFPKITVTEEADTLVQKLSVLVKGHDKAVLDSYEFFATTAAKELDIKINKVFEPPRDIERFTLLKSVHIFNKHRVQYEMRTHYRCIELVHLTGSTARVYLEYIQRNLPEGVAMQATKTVMEKIPDHIIKPLWKEDMEDKPSQ